ncbi:MAG: enoyl-CoA hydratase-related protein [Gammaproteobacteria bacterium]
MSNNANKTVKAQRRGRVLELTLDRPKANAIDAATSRELGGALMAFRDDPQSYVAILTGAGDRIFSAGWDLKAAAAGDENASMDYGPGGFGGLTELFDLDKPVIAALNGIAAGGGFEIALAADLIVAAEHVEVFLPEVTLGITADAGGLLRLPKKLPRNIAAEMLLTGRRMGAAEALSHGLFNAVVPATDLMDKARELADTIAACAPLSLRAVKEVTRATEELGVRESYELLRSGALPVYSQMLQSEDAKEGPRAFAEKRKPQWKGR